MPKTMTICRECGERLKACQECEDFLCVRCTPDFCPQCVTNLDVLMPLDLCWWCDAPTEQEALCPCDLHHPCCLKCQGNEAVRKDCAHV